MKRTNPFSIILMFAVCLRLSGIVVSRPAAKEGDYGGGRAV